jgi:uncharacterized protein (TIGR02466 family)
MTVYRHKELLFPTPLYFVDFKDTEFCDDVVVSIKKIQNNNEGIGDALCWTTPDNLNSRPEFFHIKHMILNEIGQIFDDIGLIREDYYMTCMWANVSKAYNRHALHPHANSFFSGVLYLSTPGKPGNIGFKDPRWSSEMWCFDYQPGSIFQSRTIEAEPRKGRMLVFPSWLHHGTLAGEFDDSEDRISLSFNILPKANIQGFTKKLSI